jgi:hypothetical protein
VDVPDAVWVVPDADGAFQSDHLLMSLRAFFSKEIPLADLDLDLSFEDLSGTCNIDTV